MQVIALDKEHQHGTEDFSKPCDGLLASGTQRSFIRDGSTLPVDAIANLQISNVKTVDVAASPTCNYQRSYVNINHHAFNLWMKLLIPTSVKAYHDSLCQKIWREDDKWYVIFRVDGWEQYITTHYLAGADDTGLVVWRHLYLDHQIRKYVAIQQWFTEKYPMPFYSCTLDNAITDCYSWSISKDGYFISGGAYPMKDGQMRFATLKKKVSAFQFQFGKAVKSGKCMMLSPSRWQDFVCGKDNVFLIGEAARFTNTSSLEEISHALDSAEILCSVLLKRPEKLSTACRRATHKLCLKLFGKVVKS